MDGNKSSTGDNAMIERRYGLTIEADIHGMRCADAKRQLELLIARAPKDITEIIVIHGCHGGTALRDMIRREYAHRVPRLETGIDPGVTDLVLREF